MTFLSNILYQVSNFNSYIMLILSAPLPLPSNVQGFCSNVVWCSPEVSCDSISGYDVRLYHPQSAHQNLTRHVEAKGTFYVITDEDRQASSDAGTLVQVALYSSHYFTPVSYLFTHYTLNRFELYTVVVWGTGVREFPWVSH